MTIVAMSDTHDYEVRNVPEGDVLIHAGDSCLIGSARELHRFIAWFSKLPHKHKVCVAGNHDRIFQLEPALSRVMLGEGITYLEDSMVTIGAFTIYGTPWTPAFNNWAFNLVEDELRLKYARIPQEVPFLILVSHGPPLGVGDGPDGLGSPALAQAVERTQPLLHVFGHIHEGYGVYPGGRTLAVNAALCDANYRLRNAPVVIHL